MKKIPRSGKERQSAKNRVRVRCLLVGLLFLWVWSAYSTHMLQGRDPHFLSDQAPALVSSSQAKTRVDDSLPIVSSSSNNQTLPAKEDQDPWTLVLQAKVTLIDVKVASNSFLGNDKYYENVKAIFCPVDWSLQKENPSKGTMIVCLLLTRIYGCGLVSHYAHNILPDSTLLFGFGPSIAWLPSTILLLPNPREEEEGSKDCFGVE